MGTNRYGSTAARRLEVPSADAGPAELRSLLVGGPVTRPHDSDAPHGEAAPNLRIATALDDNEEGEPTLIWDRRDTESADEAPRPEPPRPKTSPRLDEPKPPLPHATLEAPRHRRLRWVVAGLAVTAAGLALPTWAPEQPATTAPAFGTTLLAATPEAPPSVSQRPTDAEPKRSPPAEEELLIVVEDETLDRLDSPEPAAAQGTQRHATRTRRRLAHRLARDGGVALTIGDRGSAIDFYAEALRANPSLASAAAGLSAAYFDEGRFELAVKYAERAVMADFDNADHHVALGDAYYRTGAVDDARVQYETAVQLGSARAQRRLAKL